MKLRFFAAAVFLFGSTEISLGQEEVTLERVVTMALEKNFDVLAAKNVADVAQVDKDLAWGAFVPQINAVASTLHTENNQELEFADATRNNKGSAESNNQSASVQLVWTLFDGTRMFHARQRIASIDKQSELLLKEQMSNTISAVVITYYDIVRQKQQLKAIIEQMSVSEERVKLAQRKLDVGTGIKPELLQAKVDYNAQRAQVLQQESIIEQLKQQLNVAVGLQLPERYEVSDTILINPNVDAEILSTNLENSNYGLMAQRESLQIANATLRESRSLYFPTLNFNAAYTYNRNDNVRLINPFGPVFSLTDGFNYGLTLSLPILNNFSVKRTNQVAKINVDQQQIFYGRYKAQVNLGLNNALVNYKNAKQILQLEEETIGLAKENVFIALEGFKRGVTTFIELRTAQQSLEQAYNRLIAARYNTKLAETELLRLSGGLLK
jgi:outer membrane protein